MFLSQWQIECFKNALKQMDTNDRVIIGKEEIF